MISVRVLVFAAVYAVVGVVSADLAGSAASPFFWRRLAWLLSAAAFATHISIEHFRQRTSARTTAMRVSLAAALGACGLAAWANIRWWIATSSYRGSMLLSIVLWPLLVLIPAFVVALIGAIVLDRLYRRA